MMMMMMSHAEPEDYLPATGTTFGAPASSTDRWARRLAGSCSEPDGIWQSGIVTAVLRFVSNFPSNNLFPILKVHFHHSHAIQ